MEAAAEDPQDQFGLFSSDTIRIRQGRSMALLCIKQFTVRLFLSALGGHKFKRSLKSNDTNMTDISELNLTVEKRCSENKQIEVLFKFLHFKQQSAFSLGAVQV